MVTKSEAFPSRFWKASDLPARGLIVKIAKLQLEKVGIDQNEKYTLYFRGQNRQLILNPTNWDSIAEFCGADSDTWTGKDIVLYPDKTPFGGKTVDCIRVRRPKPPQATPVAKQPEPKEPPPDQDGDPGWEPAGDVVDEDELA